MSEDQRRGEETGRGPDHADEVTERIEVATRSLELADPDVGLGAVDRFVNRAVEVLGVATLVVMVGTIFFNAFGRYAFDAHLLWAEELVLLLMPWLAMTGTFLAVRRGTMIRIDFFYDRMPAAVRGPLAIAGYVLCVGMLVFLGVISSRFVTLFGRDPSPYLDVPTGWSTVALAVGGFAVAVAFLATMLRELVAMMRGARGGS